MKTKITTLILSIIAVPFAFSQGFLNLDFESANISGYPPNSMNVPISSALPGWGAYFISGGTTNTLTQVGYDAISLGSAGISVIDSNAPAFSPLQGNYSAMLFGSGFVTTAISQTGLVPNGTKSLMMDIYASDSFEVTLGGQAINMVPLQIFSNYTLYGGDISSFANQVETLTLLAPPTGVPNITEWDAIVFSPSSIPEPSVFGLLILGGLFFGLRRRHNQSR